MPARLLREGILTSERINRLSLEAELFYRRLMSRVDDYGRYELIFGLLPADLYPLRVQLVTVHDCLQWLNECVREGVVVAYQFDGKKYLEMLDTKWQLRGKPRHPEPEKGVELQHPLAVDDDSSPRRSRIRSRSRIAETETEAETEAWGKPRKVKNTAEGSPTRPAEKPDAGPKEPTPTNTKANSETWAAYAKAYEERYEVPPVRNAKSNAIVDQLVKRLGAGEAPAVAAFYCQTAKWAYAEAKHPLTLLLRDAEGLRTEWVTGRAGTRTEAMDGDRKQATANSFKELIEDAEREETGAPPTDLARRA